MTQEDAGGVDLLTLWLLDECSWIQLESQTGLPEEELREIADAVGFVRLQGSQRWNRGPCVSCGEAYDAEELDEIHRCATCRRKLSKNGTAPTWLERERAASRERMAQRDRGELPPLDRTYT